jgi:hypothetical protein
MLISILLTLFCAGFITNSIMLLDIWWIWKVCIMLGAIVSFNLGMWLGVEEDN